MSLSNWIISPELMDKIEVGTGWTSDLPMEDNEGAHGRNALCRVIQKEKTAYFSQTMYSRSYRIGRSESNRSGRSDLSVESIESIESK